MATVNKRTYPNNYFAWYNDDNRIALITEDTTSTSGERTTEKYDTFQGSGDSGTISAFANYAAGSHDADVKATSSNHGLLTGDSITIADADTSAHNGTHTITRIDDNNFYFEATFGADSTASWSSDNVINGLRITNIQVFELEEDTFDTTYS